LYYNAKAAGGTPATADLRGWWDTNRNLINENFIFTDDRFPYPRLQVFVSGCLR